MNVRVTKEFKFEMAHALLNHDGPCKNIHGHSYMLSVTLKGQPEININSPKAGMVIDFADIKKIVDKEIIHPFDHALVLNKNTLNVMDNFWDSQKLILVDFQPTCENLLVYFVQQLKKHLPEQVVLHHLLLRETSTSYAEWYLEDNQWINCHE